MRKKYTGVFTVILIILLKTQVFSAQSSLTVRASPGNTLTIDVPAGEISISTTNQNRVTVYPHGISFESVKLNQTKKNIRVEFDVEKLMSEYIGGGMKIEEVKNGTVSNFNNFTLVRNGRVVEPIENRDKSLKSSPLFAFSNAIHLQVEVPRNFNVKVATGNGNIKIARSIEGNISTKTENGNIILADIYGDLNARTAAGKIVAGKIDGNASIKTVAGDVDIFDVNGDAEIYSAAGNVKISQIKGKLDIRATNGAIEIGIVKKPSTIYAKIGDVKVKEVSNSIAITTEMGSIFLNKASGETKLFTTAGNINVENVYGSIVAKSQIGDITAHLPVSEKRKQSLFYSKKGNINIKIDPKLKAIFHLNVKETGSIYSHLLEANTNAKVAKLSVNGGTKPINIQTVKGSIYVYPKGQ